MSGKRESKKSHTRKVILDAAAGLFSDKGYEQTTIEQITRVAGVGKATLYGYFPSKEDIYMVLSIDAIAAAILASSKRVDIEKTFIEKCVSIYLALFVVLKNNKELTLFIINNLYRKLCINGNVTDLITFCSNMVKEKYFVDLNIDNNVSVLIFANFASAVGLWHGGYLGDENIVSEYIEMLFIHILEENQAILL